MLTRLEVDGFKTFEALKVDLAPFTAVVGANAAGKSNLFDAIQMLSSLATRDVNEAIKEMRGEPRELFRQTREGRSTLIRLAAEVLIDPIVRDPWGTEVPVSHTRMRYEVDLEWRQIRAGVERIQVARESAIPIRRKCDEWAKGISASRAFCDAYLKYKPNPRPWLTTEQLPGGGGAFHIHQDGHQGRRRPANAAEATVLSSITNAEFPQLFALREEMRQWRLLQLDPALLRRPSPTTAGDELEPDGSNLAAVLARIKAETQTNERDEGVLVDIAAELNSLIPGVRRLHAELNEASREYRVSLTMRDELPFTSRVISDGTLRVLALLTLLHDPRHRGLICFEEPENGIHPARVKLLVESLRSMVTQPAYFQADEDIVPLSQLLVNSHSPVVLSALVNNALHAVDGAILFADTTSVADPGHNTTRRKTRLRPVRPQVQDKLDLGDGLEPEQGFVSEFEVSAMLDSTATED